MIVKFIAETEAERQRFGNKDSVDHYNVKEYFVAGNKVDADGSLVDFHEWNGAWRYLLGTLNYFYEVIYADMRKSLRGTANELPPIQTIGQNVMPMVKKGTGGPIQNLDLTKLRVAEGMQQNQRPQQVDAVIEDDFVEEEPTLKVSPDMPPHQDDIDAAADVVAEQLKTEAEQNPQGLRIVP